VLDGIGFSAKPLSDVLDIPRAALLKTGHARLMKTYNKRWCTVSAFGKTNGLYTRARRKMLSLSVHHKVERPHERYPECRIPNHVPAIFPPSWYGASERLEFPIAIRKPRSLAHQPSLNAE